MTIRFNEKDEVSCYMCDAKEQVDSDQTFESVTLYEAPEVGNGTYTFFLCPMCRKKALMDVISEEFRKRYKKANGEEWNVEEEDG